jgi:hypothetical protein
VLVALSLPFTELTPYNIAGVYALWYAWVCSAVPVAASGNDGGSTPKNYYPASIPWVIGAGGFNWLGEFWDANTTCYDDGEGTAVGPLNVDVCAPASGGALTTLNWYNEEEGPLEGTPYAYSTLKTSGASAEIAGAVGFLQLVLDDWGYSLWDVEAAGVIEATALDFEVDPTTHNPCTSCPREYFGRGQLNVAGAFQTALALRVPDNDSYWVFSEIRYDSPGVTIEEDGSPFSVGDATYQRWKVTAEIELDPSDDAYLPDYVGYVDSRDSYLFYKHGTEEMQVMMAYDGINGCTMSLIDQSTGEATITGYLYEDTQAGFICVPPEDMSIWWGYYTRTPVTGLEEDTRIDRVEILRGQNPASVPVHIRYTVPRPSTVQLDLVDAGGRRVTRLAQGQRPAGLHRVSWNGRDEAGRDVPAGVYWMKLTAGEERVVEKIVLTR